MTVSIRKKGGMEKRRDEGNEEVGTKSPIVLVGAN